MNRRYVLLLIFFIAGLIILSSTSVIPSQIVHAQETHVNVQPKKSDQSSIMQYLSGTQCKVKLACVEGKVGEGYYVGTESCIEKDCNGLFSNNQCYVSRCISAGGGV